jgi:hypothetical protein
VVRFCYVVIESPKRSEKGIGEDSNYRIVKIMLQNFGKFAMKLPTMEPHTFGGGG